MATRYDQKTKDQVVKFVVDYNKKNGRGGQTAANKKWGINPISIANWLEKAGVSTPGKKRKASKKATKGTRRSSSSLKGSSVTAVLARMQAIQAEIDSLQKEFDSLKGKI